MRNKILITAIILLSVAQEATAMSGVVLKPSLAVTMQKQEALLKKNILEGKKIANMNRLAAIRQASLENRAKTSQKSSATQSGIGTITVLKPTVPSNTPPSTVILASSSPSEIKNVDMNRVRVAWFGWYNDYRKSLSLGSYIHDPRLDNTAHDWNTVFAAGKGQNHHTRNAGDGYYNFSVIDKWFATRGINPKVINRSKHTENVGYGYYSCSQSDCTDELIASIRSTWNFYMSEKGKSYDAHYRSIVNPYFTKMGFDIITVPSEKRYYITVHYITE